MINANAEKTNNVQTVDRYAPLSPWMYVGLMLLFYIPIVGLVFMIIYSADDSNINRRNYARAYLGVCLVSIAVMLILGAIGVSTGFLSTFMERFRM